MTGRIPVVLAVVVLTVTGIAGLVDRAPATSPPPLGDGPVMSAPRRVACRPEPSPVGG